MDRIKAGNTDADDNHVDLAGVNFLGDHGRNLLMSLGIYCLADELQSDITAGVLQHRDNDLQVVTPFAGEANRSPASGF